MALSYLNFKRTRQQPPALGGAIMPVSLQTLWSADKVEMGLHLSASTNTYFKKEIPPNSAITTDIMGVTYIHATTIYSKNATPPNRVTCYGPSVQSVRAILIQSTTELLMVFWNKFLIGYWKGQNILWNGLLLPSEKQLPLQQLLL